MKRYCCANCSEEITRDFYMCQDNFLQVKFFDNNKLNRFCSPECFCEFMMLESVDVADLPLDDDEYDSDEENEEELYYSNNEEEF